METTNTKEKEMKTTNTNTYVFYTDPGHGWLAVEIEELKRLGIYDKVSDYSYRKGQMAFLEEDCDYALFHHAKEAAGEKYTTRTIHQENTPIRSYARFEN